jgi:two-component system chemotaxis sensor kinase CheA
MSDSDERDFVARFMGEYFAECEEHLAEVRGRLLALEQSVGTGRPPQPVLDDLFRNFHSLKGISAIADMGEGERLAHEMESYLRVLRDDGAPLTAPGLDALVAGTQTFEALLQAKRANGPLPAIEPSVALLAAVARQGGASDARAGEAPARAASAPDPARRWLVTFTPSPELVGRGVKVDGIRQRLMAIGQIESVTPRVLDAGRIAFEFELTTEDEAALLGWRDDGIAFAPVADGRAGSSDTDGALGPKGVDVPAATANYVRVDLARLDDLMRHVAEMVVTRSRLADVLQRGESAMTSGEWRALAEHSDRLERQLRDLREGVMRVRLVPVGELFRRMPFVVRDLARDDGKRVHIHLAGQGTEIDKFLIERMLDPVLHLVRNAVSHGIEPPERRIAAGKPPEGSIRLSAFTVGESVVLEIADDGGGLDRAAILRRAVMLGFDPPADGSLDDRQLLDIVCSPGFSTRDQADRASGRGVGMAIVRDTVRELGGTLDVTSAPGQGTTYRITLPLTLAITDALLVTVGAHTFAVPQAAVQEAIEIDPGAITAIEGTELVVYRGGSLAIMRLSRLFDLDADPVRPRLHALVVGGAGALVGLLVDRVVGQREIVVKTITDPLIKVDGVTGVTELGDGRVILILDAAWLGQHGRGRAAVRQAAQGGRS